MARAERRAAADPDRSEAGDGPGSDGLRQRCEMGLVVDLDVLLAELRTGIALLAKRGRQGNASGDDVGSDDRIARLDRERVAQSGSRSRTSRIEPRQLDRSKSILLSRIGSEDDAQCRPVLLRPRLDGGVIIALCPQQLREQI